LQGAGEFAYVPARPSLEGEVGDFE
jgi:hypothetical protein